MRVGSSVSVNTGTLLLQDCDTKTGINSRTTNNSPIKRKQTNIYKSQYVAKSKEFLFSNKHFQKKRSENVHKRAREKRTNELLFSYCCCKLP